jgi:hypothetical protein
VVLVLACPDLSLTTLMSVPICNIRLACVALVVNADARHAGLRDPAVVVAGEIVGVDWRANGCGEDQIVVLPQRAKLEPMFVLTGLMVTQGRQHGRGNTLDIADAALGRADTRRPLHQAHRLSDTNHLRGRVCRNCPWSLRG